MNRKEYEESFPNYCQNCRGKGIFKDLSKPSFQDCPECLMKNICPQCAEKSKNLILICDECGWDRNSSPRGLPDK
ncbi:hypothetical protein H206_01690 [Candidatus Electrothrix aarhusensis]|uniref:Uncharacterized protein n=1 Tax=Candidatus Electrothrix aarhusensis TaxID=1859131 RepID=A0A3S3U604_9BACT|nr:hypothetical protein H206_01690 [Candidatus Electrothrix aarhusensis]